MVILGVAITTSASTGEPFTSLACNSGFNTTDSLSDGHFLCANGLMTNAPNCQGISGI